MARSINLGELLDSDRWISFLESTVVGLQLELLIMSQDENLSIKAPAVCPVCHAVFAPLNNSIIETLVANPPGEISLEGDIPVFSTPLQDGLVMLARECLCIGDKHHPSLADRGRVAAKLLSSFQMALTEGIEGGQRAVELSTLRQLNHFVLSLCQGEGSALTNTFDLILSAIIILLDAAGSWLEFEDPKFPALMIKGDADAVNAARINILTCDAITVEIYNHNSHGKLGVLLPRNTHQAAGLLPLMAQECTIAIEINNLFHLLNKQLNQVLEAVASAVLLIDKRHTITFANRRAEKLMKKTNMELLGSPINHWLGPWLTFLNSETGVPVRGEMECFKLDAVNSRWVDWQMSPLLEGSTIMGWLLLFDDRTDYYHWQEAARQAERFATTATIVGALAHELRNPLGAAQGLLQLMGRKRDPEQTRNYTDLVLRELDRVTRLLNEFLLLGKPANIEIEPLDPVAFLKELFPLFQGEANGTETEIILDIPSIVSPIAADSGQLTQVMLNLVRNAIQAVDYSGKVTIILRESYDLVTIEVKDNGPGFTPEAYANLFKPFFTTKERGTGLGLPVVQAIVHNHGAKITASHNPEGGAVFSLSFPPAEKDKVLSIDVLIAVKDKIFTYPAERAFLSVGFKVMTFSSLERAIQEAHQCCPAVVITEVTDARKSEELVVACRTQWPNVKILLLTPSLTSSESQNEKSVNYVEYPAELKHDFLQLKIKIPFLPIIVSRSKNLQSSKAKPWSCITL